MKKCIELYVDVSASYGGVHLKYDDIKNILNDINVDIYLMHIDDEKLIRQLISNTNINIAEI